MIEPIYYIYCTQGSEAGKDGIPYGGHTSDWVHINAKVTPKYYRSELEAAADLDKLTASYGQPVFRITTLRGKKG